MTSNTVVAWQRTLQKPAHKDSPHRQYNCQNGARFDFVYSDLWQVSWKLYQLMRPFPPWYSQEMSGPLSSSLTRNRNRNEHGLVRFSEETGSLGDLLVCLSVYQSLSSRIYFSFLIHTEEYHKKLSSKYHFQTFSASCTINRYSNVVNSHTRHALTASVRYSGFSSIYFSAVQSAHRRR